MELPDNQHDLTVPEVTITPEQLEPDAVINIVQKKRLQGLLGLTGEGPDKDTMMLMRDLSSTAVAQKRINVDKETAKGEQESAALMAKALSSIGQNPFSKAALDGDVAVSSTLEIPTLPAVTPVPGELSQEPDEVDMKVTD